jgi:hypothetical protein
MSRIRNVKTPKRDQKADQAVVASAHLESEWEKAVQVEPKTVPTSIRLSPRTIKRAKFFARVHHERGYQTWLKRVVEERIDTEYELYKRLKNDAV